MELSERIEEGEFEGVKSHLVYEVEQLEAEKACLVEEIGFLRDDLVAEGKENERLREKFKFFEDAAVVRIQQLEDDALKEKP